MRLNRRKFIKKATLLAGAGSLFISACKEGDPNSKGTTLEDQQAPAVHTRPKQRWKMVTTWPPKFKVLGEGAEMIAHWISEMSNGELEIMVYGGGELVGPLEAFDAVQSGTVQMGHGASYYWAGKAPATQFFAAVPFGMNAQQMNAWLLSGGGMALWEELYAQFNLIPFVAGNTGVQMGGWFNKRINSTDDFRGLKMRMPGLGGKVINKAGASAVLVAGGEIFPNLERGVIDATEWIGPYHDYLMGFPKIAKYYYYPGWHEPGTVLEMFVNRSAFLKLPGHLQAIIRAAAARSNSWMLAEFEAKNSLYLGKIRSEFKTEVLKFPEDVLSVLKRFARESIAEIADKDPFSKKVYASFKGFQEQTGGWADLTEKAFYAL